MKTSKIALPLILSMVLVAGAGSVFAEDQDAPEPDQSCVPCPGFQGGFHGFHHGMRGPGWMGYGPCGYGPADGMDPGFRGALSDEGQARYDKIMSEYRGKIDKVRDELFVRKSELRALERSSTPDVKAVTDKANEIVSLRGQLRSLRDEMDQTLEKEVFAPERRAFEDASKSGAPR